LQVSIFAASGSTIQPNVAAIILGVVNIVATIGANLCIDRVGRKVLLYISNVGMIASLSAFGAYFYMKDAMNLEAPGTITFTNGRSR
jgi:facilitated trehalose transporter